MLYGYLTVVRQLSVCMSVCPPAGHFIVPHRKLEKEEEIKAYIPIIAPKHEKIVKSIQKHYKLPIRLSINISLLC